VLIETLSNKMQFGVFPNSFMMNLVLDHFLKDNNMDGKKLRSHKYWWDHECYAKFSIFPEAKFYIYWWIVVFPSYDNYYWY